ncbi:MAG: hypothetical protein Q4C41_08160 [Eggerthellaceae bacterium]|nr:hypothetical protein [Eggerthellaceae bacterium]
MRPKREEYDWINDPFDEKKCAEELERARGGKAAGCGLAVVVVAALALIVGAVVAIGALGAAL